jgi:hypothetical protein
LPSFGVPWYVRTRTIGLSGCDPAGNGFPTATWASHFRVPQNVANCDSVDGNSWSTTGLGWKGVGPLGFGMMSLLFMKSFEPNFVAMVNGLTPS